jgi:hypothetical protein
MGAMTRAAVRILNWMPARTAVPAIVRSLAFSVALATPAAHAEDSVVATATDGDCALTLEANARWNTLRLRSSHPRHETCHLARDVTLALLSHAFDQPARLPAGPLKSLALGRLIDYPWLTQQLITAAASDPNWDNARGKPRAAGMNAYVSDLLARTPAIAELDAALRKGGYRITKLSVEKVLVGAGADLPVPTSPAGKLPFDAQVWLVLEKSEGPE